MPNRILSSKINVSNSLSKLSPLEEVLFLHLIVSCDDYGRFYGHPDIVNGMLFSRRGFSAKQVESAMQKLEAEGMIRRYECDGAVFLELTSWLKYQKPRAKESKFPDPKNCVIISEQMQADVDKNEHEPAPATEPQTSKAQERFEKFWAAYPKKQGKKAAEKAFSKAKVNDDLLEIMLNAIERAKRSAQWQRENGQYIPNPATWLNQGRWEDELSPSSQAKVPLVQQRNTFVPNHAITDGQSDNPFR